jgi:DNA transformation protein and related proteins
VASWYTQERVGRAADGVCKGLRAAGHNAIGVACAVTDTAVASDSFREFLREQLAPLGRVTMRRMFGKTGVFCDGLMFGMVTDNMLYLRVDDHNRAAFKEAESFPPLSYEKKGSTIDLSFWRSPERLFDEPDELVTWARIALAAARRVAAKREGTAPGENQSHRIRASGHEVRH